MKNRIFQCKFMVCLFCVLLGMPKAVFSQEKTTMSDSMTLDSLNVFKAMPVLYYTPETGFALEAFAYYTFKLKNAERASNARFFATYTQMKQYMFILPVQLYTNNEVFFINSYNDCRYFPEFF